LADGEKERKKESERKRKNKKRKIIFFFSLSFYLDVSALTATQEFPKGPPTKQRVAFGVAKTALEPRAAPESASTATSAVPSSSTSTFSAPPSRKTDEDPPAATCAVPTFASGNSLFSRKMRETPEEARKTFSAVRFCRMRSAAPMLFFSFFEVVSGVWTGETEVEAESESEEERGRERARARERERERERERVKKEKKALTRSTR
jgi:hypothetical protein